jgi:hypothetical protein
MHRAQHKLLTPSFFERELANFADAYFLVRRQLIREFAFKFGERQ